MANDRLYVIINDVSSLDIEGLYIEELPPISKPTMRSLREEIDGKDGDIITKLGYSAYDKEMKIGLAQNYDINEVISFFNSKGKIQFSNELDKYYNFEILEQIDFTALQTFKTAVVTLHCQPFKYPVEETPIEGQLTPVSVEGNSFHVSNTSRSSIKVDIIGNTFQKPTSFFDPQEIIEGSQSTIGVLGKNIAYIGIDSLLFENTKITSSGSIVSDNDYDVYFVPIMQNEEYTLSIKNTSNVEKTISANLYDFSNFRVGRFSYTIPESTKIEQTFIANDNSSHLYLSIPKTYAELQLEFGSEATPYEESEQQIYMINLIKYGEGGVQKINKIGNYYDFLFKNIQGSPYYSEDLVFNAWYVKKQINKVIVPSGSVGITIDDMLPNSTIFSKYGGSVNGNYIDYSGYTLPSDDTILYITTTPTYVRLAEPESYDYLNEYITSYTGETNIFITGNLSVNIKAEISVSNNIEIVINNCGNIYSKPKLDIAGYGIINVSLNDNQIFSVNIEDEIIIDSSNLEAYNPNTNQLMNRQVVGNIDNLKLEPGESTLKFTGNVTSVSITDYTRYL